MAYWTISSVRKESILDLFTIVLSNWHDAWHSRCSIHICWMNRLIFHAVVWTQQPSGFVINGLGLRFCIPGLIPGGQMVPGWWTMFGKHRNELQNVPIFSLMIFTQQQLWYKEQQVLVLWACSLNDSKRATGSFSLFVVLRHKHHFLRFMIRTARITAGAFHFIDK